MKPTTLFQQISELRYTPTPKSDRNYPFCENDLATEYRELSSKLWQARIALAEYELDLFADHSVAIDTLKDEIADLEHKRDQVKARYWRD